MCNVIGEDAPRVRNTQIARHTTCTCRLTNASNALHLLSIDNSALLHSRQQRRRGFDIVTHLVIATANLLDILQDRCTQLIGQREICSERTNQPFTKTVAAPQLSAIDCHRAQSLASHLTQLITDVHTQRARIGNVHRHTLQLQRYGTLHIEVARLRRVERSQLLDRAHQCRGMRYGTIARNALGQQHLTQQALRGFDLSLGSAMLVSERDFEVQDLLAITDKAERSRLDDTRVNRAHIDLVQ